MAITYEFFDSNQTLISRVVGRVTEKQWFAYREYLVTDTNINHGYHELLDLRGITSLDLTSQSMERFAELKRKHADKFADRRGALVVPDEEIFGLARYVEKLDAKNNEHTTVFNHLDVALTWLGVSIKASEAARSDKPLANTFMFHDVDDEAEV